MLFLGRLKKMHNLASTYLPRFPQEQRAQGKFFCLRMASQEYNPQGFLHYQALME